MPVGKGVKIMAELPKHVKFVQRDISSLAVPIDPNAEAAQDVEAHLDNLVEQGWTLKESHFIGRKEVGEVHEVVYGMLFVLVK